MCLEKGSLTNMRGFLLRAAIVALGLWVASEIIPGIEIRDGWSLLWAAFWLAIVNAIVRPILILFTLPLTLLTLGLFLLVINGLMVELVAALLHGFYVAGLGSAILCAIVVTLTSWAVNSFIGPQGQMQTIAVARIERY